MVWAGAGLGLGLCTYGKWCEAKIHEIDGVFETAMDDGEGMGPVLWVVGKKEKGRRSRRRSGSRRRMKRLFLVFIIVPV